MIKLGNIVLSDHLGLPNLKKLAQRAGSVRHLLDGGYVDQSLIISSGVELLLESHMEGLKEYGSFTGDQVDAMNALRATREKVVFIHHLGQWLVKVMNVDVEQVDDIVNPTGDDLYVGTITLLIV